MSIGNSGRIVIEVHPDLKKQLYSSLTRDGMSLKEWFLRNAELYITNGGQLALSLSSTPGATKLSIERKMPPTA
jgi:putative alpha-1,2-mannosidase